VASKARLGLQACVVLLEPLALLVRSVFVARLALPVCRASKVLPVSKATQVRKV